jgi:hypothetical protein
VCDVTDSRALWITLPRSQSFTTASHHNLQKIDNHAVLPLELSVRPHVQLLVIKTIVPKQIGDLSHSKVNMYLSV